MSRRRASDGAGSVLSFTFLDVLMCTMGSLLLLLVVFGVIVKKSTRARREGEDVKLTLAALQAPDAPPPAAAAPPADAAPVAVAEEITKQLAKLRSEQPEIERLRGEAAQRRLEEQDRIAHLEDHERRLEHELGQLHVTLQVLEATEQKQNVDQQQAEAEVERLKELITETEARLDDLRKKSTGEKSYAIVPYKGANGTFRQPVFIECTADAVTIQPEGIRLTVEDFDGPLRSGNPLAAAIRAAHEELNGRAVAAGRTDLPDPYPLLIVRPDGAAAYAAALDAIRSWDSDYGYEFVEADWKLKYSEPDPRLAQIMAHAVDEARQRQALLARVAPRQYAPRLAGGGGGAGAGIGAGDGGPGGFGELATSGAGNRIGAHGGDGAFGDGGESGNSLRYGGNGANNGMGLNQGGGGGSGDGNFSDEFVGGDSQGGGQLPGGQLTTGAGAGTGTGAAGNSGQNSYAVGQGAEGAQGVGGSRYAESGVNGQPAGGQPGQTGQNGAGTSGTGGTGGSDAGQGSTEQNFTSTGSSTGGASAGGSSAGGAAGAGASAGGSSGGGGATSGNMGSMGGLQQVQTTRRGSVADKRGANWANAEAARRTSAITRPVRIVVNADKLTVLPESGSPTEAAIVSFQQPVDRVVDQLAGAVQMQVVDWGLAGDGMYWRPTLVVTVTPGAQRQAERLAELLENSGLDVRLPQSTAAAAQPERK